MASLVVGAQGPQFLEMRFLRFFSFLLHSPSTYMSYRIRFSPPFSCSGSSRPEGEQQQSHRIPYQKLFENSYQAGSGVSYAGAWTPSLSSMPPTSPTPNGRCSSRCCRPSRPSAVLVCTRRAPFSTPSSISCGPAAPGAFCPRNGRRGRRCMPIWSLATRRDVGADPSDSAGRLRQRWDAIPSRAQAASTANRSRPVAWWAARL